MSAPFGFEIEVEFDLDEVEVGFEIPLLDEARAVLRQRFLDADVGITGANFLIAETGSTVIVTNEGKLIARLGGEDGLVNEPNKFMAPHGLAVDSRGDIYVGEVSYTNWPASFGDQPRPEVLHTLKKLEKVT